jgi:hypothetical protein
MTLRVGSHRLFAMFVMGILVGLYRYHDYTTWNQRGKDTFIAHQLQRFDRYMAHPHSLFVTLASTALSYALILGIYELIATSVRKVLPSSDSTATSSTPIGVRSQGSSR